MFTVCPKCSLKLVVTAADLRVAQGFVRCGRCSNVFNALAGLTDEQQAALDRESQAAAAQQRAATPAAATPQPPAERAPAPRAPVSPPPSPAQPPRGSAAQAPVTEAKPAGAPVRTPAPTQARAPASPAPTPPRPAAASPTAPAPPRPPASPRPPRPEEPPIPDGALEFNPIATDVTTVFVQAVAPADESHSGTFESIVLSSEDAPSDAESEDAGAESARDATASKEATALEETADTDTIQFELEEIAARLDARHAAGTAERTAATAAAGTRGPARTAELAGAESEGQTADPVREAVAAEFLPAERSHRASVASRVAAAILALALAAQVAHHYRTELAGIDTLRAPLTSLYRRLGVPLASHWDVHAYEVHQLGAFAGVPLPGELTIRASVKNTASKLQPLPLLRVMVQDSFGNRVASRDVAPAAYVKGGVARDFLSAGQRIDAEVAFVDPGQNAVGFEIDACLELAAGRIACANDPAQR